MSEHTAKRSRLSIEDVPSVEEMLSVDEVLMVIDDEESQPMMLGSDDEFEDITYLEKERDEYGAIEPHLVTNSAPIIPPPSPIPSQASTPTPPPHAPIPMSLPHAPTLPHAATPTSLPHAATPTTPPIPVRQTRVTSAGGSNDWSTTLSPIDVAPFNQPVGPQYQHLGEVFDLFFTDEICSLVVSQSTCMHRRLLETSMVSERTYPT